MKGGASWFVAEGAEEVKGASSMPLAKAMDDCLVAYGMNGEAVRPQQGFPLRLMVPGFEGIFSDEVSAANQGGGPVLHELQRLRASSIRTRKRRRWVTRSDRNRSSRSLPADSSCPAADSTRSAAWPGPVAAPFARWRCPPTAASTGRTPRFKGTAHRMAHTRFGYQWNWDGKETELLSRCTDELGQVQPSRAQVAKYWNEPLDPSYSVPGLDNTIQPWRIASDGSVHNGNA